VALIFVPYLDDRSESNHVPVISRFLAEKKSAGAQSKFLAGQGLVPCVESGEGENPYEEVEIYSDSKKDIVVQAYRGYVIYKITINGEEYPIPDQGFNPMRFERVVLDKFTNMTEDKHINVEFTSFMKGVNKVAIRTYHYLKDTTTEVSPTIRKIYLEDESYTTEPKILEKYELERNEQGEYIIPENATGTIREAKEKGNYSVIYYYVKKKAKVITKYILEK